MPPKKNDNPLAPRPARTSKANAARWQGHVALTPEERESRKLVYRERARAKYLLQRRALSADTNPGANGEVKADEAAMSSITTSPEKPVARRKKPKPDRSNGPLAKVLAEEARFRESEKRRADILKLELKTGLSSSEPTQFHGIFVPTPPDEPEDAIEDTDNYD
jgi:hypothetical protein